MTPDRPRRPPFRPPRLPRARRATADRPTRRPPIAALFTAGLLGATLLTAPPGETRAQAFPERPFSRAGMLLEKSIFRVDVLRLALRLGPETATRL